MSRLIEEIHQYLLSLDRINEESYAKFDFVSFYKLIIEFFSNEKYNTPEYLRLRRVLNLYYEIKEVKSLPPTRDRKLENYLPEDDHDLIIKNLSDVPRFQVLEEIEAWTGNDNSELKVYVDDLQNGIISYHSADSINQKGKLSGKSKKKIKSFDSYIVSMVESSIITAFLREICLRGSHDAMPRKLALYTWKLYYDGLFRENFKPELLYNNNDFAKAFYEMMLKNETEEKAENKDEIRPENMRIQLKVLFERSPEDQKKEWVKKVDKEIRDQFETLKQRAKIQ